MSIFMWSRSASFYLGEIKPLESSNMTWLRPHPLSSRRVPPEIKKYLFGEFFCSRFDPKKGQVCMSFHKWRQNSPTSWRASSPNSFLAPTDPSPPPLPFFPFRYTQSGPTFILFLEFYYWPGVNAFSSKRTLRNEQKSFWKFGRPRPDLAALHFLAQAHFWQFWEKWGGARSKRGLTILSRPDNYLNIL